MIRLVYKTLELIYNLDVEWRYLINRKNAFIKKAIDNYFLKLEDQDYNDNDLNELINHLSKIYDRISEDVKL